MSNIKDISGQTFNRWTVIGYDYGSSKKEARWVCKCACGDYKSVSGSSLRKKTSKSCGCLKGEIASKIGKQTKTHGLSGHRVYNLYQSMVNRCHSPNHISYKNYGAKGVRVCDRWLNSFESFIEDMGVPNPNDSIDRINNNLGYHPDNCRWVGKEKQNRNKSNNIKLTFSGRTMNMADWAREINIGISTLYARYKAGWSDDRIISTPLRGIR